MRPNKYRLCNRQPVACEDTLEWARWYESPETDDERTVEVTRLGPDERVSTVFLGLDHNFSDAGPPILFETRAFGGPLDGEGERTSTWQEAQAAHARMLARVMAGKVGSFARGSEHGRA